MDPAGTVVKVALVTGAARGIGRACAEALAGAGAGVTLIARDEAALRAVGGTIARPRRATVDFIVADFRDPPAVRERVEGYIRDNHGFEILVNNTGGPPAGPIVEARPEEFASAVSMHVLCNHLLVQALLPGMKQAGYGRIVNIVSTSVREPIPGLGVSNTTRSAVAGWAKSLARELGPFGITVNNVLPGYTATARLGALIDRQAELAGKPRNEIELNMRAGIPLGRFAEPAEIAAAVVFLASPAASYITGVSLPVDGGRLASI